MSERYPSRGVRVIVPLPPGGSTEFSARTVTARMQGILGQPFTVEPLVGEAGIVALRALAAARDPHTLMVGNVNTNSIVPALFARKLGFEYDRAVTPVSRLTEFPSLLVVKASVPAGTVRDFLAYAKQTWGRVRNGTDWIGSYPDIDGLFLGKAVGVEVVNVPNADAADGLLAAVASGAIDMVFLNARTAGRGIRAGTIKAIAVAGPVRLAGYPDVPTMAEAGFAGIGTPHWQGLFAPGGTPAEVVGLLHRTVAQALAADEVRAAFEPVDVRVTPSASPAQFAEEIRAERARWDTVKGELGLAVE
ncbi:MAG TPA: tripartite tricarboxylate transporter substrate binding protein [Acidimicrobiales bacterium]